MPTRAQIERDDCRRKQAIRERAILTAPASLPANPEEEARLREQAKNFPVTKLPYMGDTFSEDLPEPRPKQTRKVRPKQARRERLDDERRQRINDIMARYT